MNFSDPKLGILSSQSVLTDKLSNKFSDKFIETQVFDDINKIKDRSFNYLVVNAIEDLSLIDDLMRLISDIESKIIILAPLYVDNFQKKSTDDKIEKLLSLNSNTGIILAPEILGDAVKYNKDYLSHNIILQSQTSERIKVNSNNFLINTISVTKLSDVIVREMFSFGISGQVVALIGPRRSPKSFITKYLGFKEDNIILSEGGEHKVELNKTASRQVDFSLGLAVKAFRKSQIISISKEIEKEEPEKKEVLVVTQRPTTKIRRFKKLLYRSIFAVIIVLLSPLLLMSTSLLSIYYSVNLSFTNADLSEKLINYSLNSLVLAQDVSLGIPVYYDYSNIFYKSAFLVKEAFDLTKIGSEFATKIVSKENYDLAFYSDSVTSILDRMYTDSGFLESDIKELSGLPGSLIKNTLEKKKLNANYLKQNLYLFKNITSRLSVLLGMDKPMKYLVLFQNNMELRPTGGFIGSFALMTFDKGRLSEIVVNDVYSADGQLKGHVEPPTPIRDYLGEGGWFLRDSNWDPDYPSSARKVEWFLYKELNTEVDGVIAIDLSFVKKMISVIGQLKLTDFNQVITPENLYSSTQSEVESNFFPGSTKKASFMAALARQLIFEIETLPKEKYFSFLKVFYDSLEERHIQLYFHDLNTQKSIEDLGYSGNIDMDNFCGNRCYFDKYSLIDANLGVNKSNLYISRNQFIKTVLNKESINHQLVVDYRNNANIAVGKMGEYKSYTRLLVPDESVVRGVRLYSLDGTYEDLKFEVFDLDGRKEIGFYFEVIPQTEKKIQIEWDVNTNLLKDGGEYKLLVRKQAGTDNDSLQLFFDKGDLTLTGRVPSVYTTTLEKDYLIKLFVKP